MSLQFNGKVERHRTGMNHVFHSSPAADGMKDRKAIEAEMEYVAEQAAIDAVPEVNRKRAEQQSMLEAATFTQRRLAALDGLKKQATGLVFKEIMFEFFVDALILDEPFKVAQEASLRAVVNSYIDERGGYKMLVEAYRQTKSPVLKTLMEACESIAGKVCNRKDCECKDGKIQVADINFDLDEEEREQIDFEKGKMSIDQISGLVRKKVIDVIKDEKSREAKEAEVEKDLEEQAAKAGVTVEEAYTAFVKTPHKLGSVAESTLFNSIQRNCLKVAIAESTVAIRSDSETEEDENEEAEYSARVNNTEDDVKQDEFQPYTTKDASEGEYSVEDEVSAYRTNGANPLNDEMYALDMDLVLAESITKYTLMEMFHTIKLEKHNHQSVRTMSQRLLNT